MIYLLSAVILLLIIALLSLIAARRAARRSGLPSGQLIYSDTGFAVGQIGPTSLNEEGVKQEKPLVSRRFGLTGRPDYLVRTSEGIIPVEAKSTRRPANGRPYDSHLFQLAAYCLLVEDVLGARVPYGIVRYADAEVAVDYTPELREGLLNLIEEMNEARLADDVHRSHEDARRCRGCSMRESCDESLV
ncbi:MAG TPA: CRISPR-associated protein Cas4 [Pyrinomonadaceae bacterium]|nr:CRISPR-associated protein Cas4 [Pyrinomonadaceae bacterium]